MSSRSGITLGEERVARSARGLETVAQPERPLRRVIADPAQLSGPRARTCIRSGHAMTPGGRMDETVIGIDVSKARLALAVHPTRETWESATTADAIEALVARLITYKPTRLVVEATGGYERAVVAACAAAGLPIAVVNPRQVRAFAEAIGRTAKTDVIDAHVL